MMYSLVFRMTPRKSSELVMGKLTLYKAGEVVSEWDATSGCRNHQGWGQWWERGKGLIPPSNEVFEEYRFKTELIASNNYAAVGEWLFAILPYNVWSADESQKRTNVAVHLDANHETSPGSAGCLVICDKDAWDDFANTIMDLDDEGEIPLTVEYEEA